MAVNKGKGYIKKPRGIRAVGIVIHDGRVLLMRRQYQGRQYFTFPGGGVESYETVEEAVVRELNEESSIKVSVTRLLYHHDLIEDSDQYFFECRYISGQPKVGGEELQATQRGDVHLPLWVALTDLAELTLYPLEVRDWLIEDVRSGFKPNTRVLRAYPQSLRQA